MNKVLKFICIALVVIGAAIATFSDVAILDYSGIAIAFVGAAVACINTYAKSEKKDWKVIVSIILIAIGSFAVGFAGIAADNLVKIISAVSGVILLIVGLFSSVIKKQ